MAVDAIQTTVSSRVWLKKLTVCADRRTPAEHDEGFPIVKSFASGSPRSPET